MARGLTYKSYMVDCMFELLRQSLFPSWTIVIFKIKGDELRPWKIGFSLRWVRVWL